MLWDLIDSPLIKLPAYSCAYWDHRGLIDACSFQWLIIHYNHYVFGCSNSQMGSIRAPLQASFCVLLTRAHHSSGTSLLSSSMQCSSLTCIFSAPALGLLQGSFEWKMAISYRDLTFNVFISIGVSLLPNSTDIENICMSHRHLHIYLFFYLSKTMTSH